MLQDEALLPRADLDADYTARATVTDAEFTAIIGRYQRLTEAAQAQLADWSEIEFSRESGLKLDLYGRKTGELRPLVVFIHGGYWRALGREHSGFAAPMLAAHGIACAVPDYRLAPAVSITRIIADCRRAIAHLWTNAEALGIDRDRIVVTGSSAGGHLAAAMAQPGWQAALGLPDQPLHGCLPVSGLFELAPLAASHVQDWMRFTAEELGQSPMRHLPQGLRGVVALAADRGESAGFHRQSEAFAALTGWPLLQIAGRNHFDVILDLADAESALFKALVGLTA
ncbi:alpha/beta hydrolase [Tabrizicola oligotrophica]|uniref:Alpha/beta hydrolase n=1 Tax=Tabrizicola oligotrophica TaxID=2710650 RepID=A0A6M0QRD8_9RHOB|nr:alpha/beta hydrolase [Tabrizicola oligotrophica]NEY89956.1 alpha/beta hydrolase [Tabrizicola oligotrophica]